MDGVSNSMNDQDAELILIRATAKRNGFTTFLGGVVALICAVVLLNLLPHSLYLIGVFALSGAIVAMLIGWFKMREPPHSVSLSKQEVHYYHRHGQWVLTWDNIQRIDVPRVDTGLQHENLDLVGIKIKDYRPFLGSISPRLATNLLMEQRPLLLQAGKCATGGCYSADLIEDDRLKLPDGTVLAGIPAMLGNRMKKLRERLGYDLFINVSELDRSAIEFCTLLRQCHQQVAQTEVRLPE